MKLKPIYIIYIILLLLLISISRGLTQEKKEVTTSFQQQLKTYSFYKSKNYSRYLSYRNKNPNLSDEQILVYVNIGLDQQPYTNINTIKDSTTSILVNKYNRLSKDYIPNNLETINTKYAYPNMKLVKVAKDSFEQMAEDALKENLTILAMSTYRNYSYQEKLYNKYVIQDGQEKADTYSARPGHSEHQTGLAVDVCNNTHSYTDFEKTKEFEWMKANAHKYGFILRYPKDKVHITTYQYEAWHYRYVGIEIATYIQRNNLTYDEYYIKYLAK